MQKSKAIKKKNEEAPRRAYFQYEYTTGRLMHWCMKKLGKSQEDLADSLGVSRATVSSWIGRGFVPSSMVRLVARELDTCASLLSYPQQVQMASREMLAPLHAEYKKTIRNVYKTAGAKYINAVGPVNLGVIE